MGGQQKNFISDIVFFQHQDGMRKKVRRHFLQCVKLNPTEYGVSMYQSTPFLFIKRHIIQEIYHYLCQCNINENCIAVHFAANIYRIPKHACSLLKPFTI